MNLNVIKLTIDQLIKSGVHLGYTRWFLNSKMKPYLVGYKNSMIFINLYYTNIQLKMFINYLYNIIAFRHKVLIIKQYHPLNLNSIFYELNNVFFYQEKWTGGYLTNFKLVKRSVKRKLLNNNSLNFMKFMPSCVIILDANISNIALIEALNLEIPVCSILDTNSKYIQQVNYPIVGNNHSFEALCFYCYLFKNAILKGRKKECFNILNII